MWRTHTCMCHLLAGSQAGGECIRNGRRDHVLLMLCPPARPPATAWPHALLTMPCCCCCCRLLTSRHSWQPPLTSGTACTSAPLSWSLRYGCAAWCGTAVQLAVLSSRHPCWAWVVQRPCLLQPLLLASQPVFRLLLLSCWLPCAHVQARAAQLPPRSSLAAGVAPTPTPPRSQPPSLPNLHPPSHPFIHPTLHGDCPHLEALCPGPWRSHLRACHRSPLTHIR